jgi:hypothetical protein
MATGEAAAGIGAYLSARPQLHLAFCAVGVIGNLLIYGILQGALGGSRSSSEASWGGIVLGLALR